MSLALCWKRCSLSLTVAVSPADHGTRILFYILCTDAKEGPGRRQAKAKSIADSSAKACLAAQPVPSRGLPCS